MPFTLNQEMLLEYFAKIVVILTVLPLHEFAHAYTAYKLGDPTAKKNGRLTLNPIRHLDPIGAIMILVVGFGYAKPVPVNPYYFKNRKLGMAVTSAAGPLSNLLCAYIFTIVFKINIFMASANMVSNTNLSLFIGTVSSFMISINIMLAVFNLLPIPPLDGSRIMALVLPEEQYFKIMKYERYIMLAVFAALFTGVLREPLSVLTRGAFGIMDFLTGYVDMIFGIML